MRGERPQRYGTLYFTIIVQRADYLADFFLISIRWMGLLSVREPHLSTESLIRFSVLLGPEIISHQQRGDTRLHPVGLEVFEFLLKLYPDLIRYRFPIDDLSTHLLGPLPSSVFQFPIGHMNNFIP